MTKKIGLIIQGPLISIGKDGTKAHVSKTILGEAGFVHFDCRQNIQKIIDDFGNLFETIVVSTWDNELRPGDGWEGATVVSLPDPGEIHREKFSNRSRNKYRQFLGIRRGLEELEKIPGIEYVVRIRTDQYLDLRKLLESYTALLKYATSPQEMIGVPLLRSADFFIHDFYFVAHLQALKKFCDAVLAFDMYEFISCVHREMLLKHAYVNYREKIAVADWNYFPHWPPMGASTETKKIFAFMFSNVFVPLNVEIVRTLLWRGSLLDERHVNQQLEGQYKDVKLLNTGSTNPRNIINVPALLSINWKRYFDFLYETTGRKISLKDVLVIKVGNLLWKLWYVVRNISKKTKITDTIYRLLR